MQRNSEPLEASKVIYNKERRPALIGNENCDDDEFLRFKCKGQWVLPRGRLTNLKKKVLAEREAKRKLNILGDSKWGQKNRVEEIDCDLVDEAIIAFKSKLTLSEVDHGIDKYEEEISNIIKALSYYEKRANNENIMKRAKSQRLIFGIKVIKKKIELNKVKLVIIAKDIEESVLEGSLATELDSLLQLCKEKKITFVRALTRRKLGRYSGYNIRHSAIGIINDSGQFHELKGLIKKVNRESDL